MTELENYFTQVLDGRIVSCEKIKQAAEMILNRLYNPQQYHFDYDIAKHHIDFIEKFCKQPSGKIGKPLKLELFQKARLETIYGFVDDNDIRQYNEVLIIEGRKNGKTTETAAVEIDLLCNDGEGAPQVYNVATARDQATLGFNAAHKMVKQSPYLKKHIRKRASDLYAAFNMGFIKALASNVNSLDGLDTHGATIDELGAIKNRDIYDLVKQSMGAREQPLLFCISTNGFVREGIFDAQYKYAEGVLSGKIEDIHFLPLIYELDSIEEWDNPDCWIKANPGLGTIKSWDYLRQSVEKAKKDESYKPTVMVKDFNMKQTSISAWLKYEEFNNEDTFKPEKGLFRYGIGGMDAADSVDLNAAKVLCVKKDDPTIYVRQMYWLPEKVIEESNRRGRDNAPYQLWKEQGLLRTVSGNRVDKRVMLDWFCEIQEEEDIYILYIGYDPWHIDDATLREFQNAFGEKTMIPVRQGVKSLSQPMKNLKADLQIKRINYNNNPIDKWCFFNTNIKKDVNGNIQPIKGLDSRERIDGTLALIDGYKVYEDKYDELMSIV